MDRLDIIRSAIFGVTVGDALGVPVEFTSRSERIKDPVTGMREYGTHYQPKGTWSDDSSMMFAAMDSIVINGSIVYEDIMDRFAKWLLQGDYTPYNNTFDVGTTCSRAIAEYQRGTAPLLCGGSSERDNGNGSLMRIMPFSLYVAMDQGYRDENVYASAAGIIHNASSLTHRHPRSLIGCMIYTSVCHELIYRGDQSVPAVIEEAVNRTLEWYEKAAGNGELTHSSGFAAEISAGTYDRMINIDSFGQLPDTEIKSSGYVVHTLEAAVWCLLNSDSYRECVLKAVNLGDDTDTVGAVAGGLAGLCYGYDDIPPEWLDVIAGRDRIDMLCSDYAKLFG